MDCEEEKENEKNNMQVGIRTVTQVFSTFSCLDVSYEPFIVFFFCFVFLDMTGGKKRRDMSEEEISQSEDVLLDCLSGCW